MKRAMFATGLAVAVVLVGSVASAKGPDIYEFEVEEDVFLWDCGDFEIWDSAQLRYRVKDFYDDAGELDRLMVHGWFTETMYNAMTGKSIEAGTNGYNFVLDTEEPGLWIHHGLMYHATVPGVGRVLIDTGYFIMDVSDWDFESDWRETVTWQRGNHQNIDGDFDKLCAALR